MQQAVCQFSCPHSRYGLVLYRGKLEIEVHPDCHIQQRKSFKNGCQLCSIIDSVLNYNRNFDYENILVHTAATDNELAAAPVGNFFLPIM